jgi:cell division protein FtsZ
MHTEELMPFAFNKKTDETKKSNSIIKVIGVGGGGGNAVENMFEEGIQNVDFIIANTDKQVLRDSKIPIKLALGEDLTEGLGAGNNPDIGKNAAIESSEKIKDLLSKDTKMVFITAGMGGGTGTGAAPIIAQIARELGILTIAVVTIPFAFEGEHRIEQALVGLSEMQNHVDSMLVINNEKISEVYKDLQVSSAFAYADKVLTTAVKGIAEIITKRGLINVDFADVKSVMQDSGVAVMGTGYGEDQNRGLQAVQNAINSPLLNNNDIKGAKNLLVNIYSPKDDEITQEELSKINIYLQEKAGHKANLIWGLTHDESLEKGQCAVTVIATEFNDNIIPSIEDIKSGQSHIYEAQKQTSENNSSINNDSEENKHISEIKSKIERAKENISKINRKPIDYTDDEIVNKYYNEPAYLRQKISMPQKNDTTNRFLNPQVD